MAMIRNACPVTCGACTGRMCFDRSDPKTVKFKKCSGAYGAEEEEATAAASEEVASCQCLV